MGVRKSRVKLLAGPCFWCQKVGPREVDHVPPRALFPQRVHKLLPNVPSCHDCNKAWSKDGNFFRDALLLGSLRDFEHPDLVEVRAARERGNDRLRRERGRRSVFDSGLSLHLGPADFAVAFELQSVDQARINVVILRTVAAIAARNRKGLVVPSGYKAIIVELPVSSEYQRVGLEVITGPHSGAYGEGLLRWYFGEADNNRDEQEWLISFYNRAIFYCRISTAARPQSGLFPGIFDDGTMFQPGENNYTSTLVADTVHGNLPPQVTGLKSIVESDRKR